MGMKLPDLAKEKKKNYRRISRAKLQNTEIDIGKFYK